MALLPFCHAPISDSFTPSSPGVPPGWFGSQIWTGPACGLRQVEEFTDKDQVDLFEGTHPVRHPVM